MKKNSWIFLFALLFFSCKNPMLEENNQKGYGVINFSSAVRTVKEDFDINSLSSIKLYQNNSEEADDILIKEWNSYQEFVSDSLSVKVGTYKFYITAKIENVEFKSDIKTVVIEEFSTNTINFKIHVTNRGEGTGIVSIMFTFGDEPVSESSFELNKISYQDGKRVLDRVELDSSVLKVKMKDESKQYYATFESNLTPGVYELETRFENTSNVAIYPVTIHVSEGCTSADKIEVLNFNPFYDITYYDGETQIADLDNTYYPTKYSVYDEVEFPQYEKSYYEFEGWYTDSSFTNKIETIDKYEFAEDLSLYAKWKLDKSQYLLFNKNENFMSNVVMQDDVENYASSGTEIYSDFTIGGHDFYYYLDTDATDGKTYLKKSNDMNFNKDALLQLSSTEWIPVNSLYYEYESDKIHGLSIVNDYPVTGNYHKYYDFSESKNAVFFEFPTDNTYGNAVLDFAVNNNTLYLLCEISQDNSKQYKIYVYDISNNINGVYPLESEPIPLFNDINDTDLDNYFIKDMIVVEGKLYILWKYYSADYKDAYNADSPAKVQCYGGVLCYDPDGNTLTELINGGNSIPSEAQEIEITKPNVSSDAHFNYFGPAEREEGSGIYDITCLFGPTKFIAIKPKKLVFADEGIFVYNDENNNAKYKNVNRVIEIDLETKEISQLSTDATFNFDKNDDISVYSLYSSITLDSVSSEQ